MAELVGAFSCSHAPILVNQFDPTRSLQHGRLVAAYQSIRQEIDQLNPDFAVVIYNDHLDNFFYDTTPTFALGVSDFYPIADEGIGGYRKGTVRGDAATSLFLAHGLVERQFDLTVCRQQMALDHGVTSPLPIVSADESVTVVPLQINCVTRPIPTAERCWNLGRAIRAVLDGLASRLRYVVVGTGGLSHQLAGPDFGLVNRAHDEEVVVTLTSERRSACCEWDLDRLLRGGEGGIEVLNWIAAAGVVGDGPTGNVLFNGPIPGSVTGMAVIRYQVTSLSAALAQA